MKKIIAVIMIWGFSFNAFSKIPRNTNITVIGFAQICKKEGKKFQWTGSEYLGYSEIRLSDFTNNRFERTIKRKDGSEAVLSVDAIYNGGAPILKAQLRVKNSKIMPIWLVTRFSYNRNKASNIYDDCNKNLVGQTGLSIDIIIVNNDR